MERETVAVSLSESQAKALVQAADHVAADVFDRDDATGLALRSGAAALRSALAQAGGSATGAARSGRRPLMGRYPRVERCVRATLSVTAASALAEAARHCARDVHESGENGRGVLHDCQHALEAAVEATAEATDGVEPVRPRG